MPVTTYLTVDGEILAENRNGTHRDYLPDPLGSTVALLNSSQTKTDTFGYDVWGFVTRLSGSIETPFQFCGTLGYYRDSTARMYVRARIYQPRYGRWMTVDPLFPGQPAFSYCSGRPLTFVDQFGLMAIPFPGFPLTSGGLVAGGAGAGAVVGGAIVGGVIIIVGGLVVVMVLAACLPLPVRTCTDSLFSVLKQWKNQYCNSDRSCKSLSGSKANCPAICARIFAGIMCLHYRRRITRDCFGNISDESHLQEETRVALVLAKCELQRTRLNCTCKLGLPGTSGGVIRAWEDLKLQS